MPRICLDAGHCSYGADAGAEGNGLKEQEITLDICKQIKPLLEQSGIGVIMTRTGDLVPGLSSGYTLNQSLQARVNIANAANVNLFVSFHVNASGGTGAEVWALAPGGNAEKCAKTVLPYLVNVGQWANRGVKFANFYVLNYTTMPAILTENGFIDNAHDANKLRDAGFRKALAIAHAQGICAYFGVEYKEQLPSKIPTGENITSFNGGGYVEYLPDRTIIHHDEYVYLCLWSDGKITSHAKGRDAVRVV